MFCIVKRYESVLRLRNFIYGRSEASDDFVFTEYVYHFKYARTYCPACEANTNWLGNLPHLNAPVRHYGLEKAVYVCL